MGEVLEFRSRTQAAAVNPRAEFDRVMERLLEAIDLIDEGARSRAAARQAVYDAAEILLNREARIHTWPKK